MEGNYLKKVIALILVLVTVLGLVACAKPAAPAAPAAAIQEVALPKKKLWGKR